MEMETQSTHPLGVIAVILGVLSWLSFCCSFVPLLGIFAGLLGPFLALVGVVLGIIGYMRISAEPEMYTGNGFAITGVLLNASYLLLFLIGLIAIFVFGFGAVILEQMNV